MKKRKNIEITTIFIACCILFGLFLLFPMLQILEKSFVGKSGITLDFYQNILVERNFGKIFLNSVGIAMLSAVITTVIAFVLSR